MTSNCIRKQFPYVAAGALWNSIHAVALLSPVTLMTAIYASWLAAWLCLGHPPRASLDDPFETLGPVYWASIIPLIQMPVGVVAGLCSALARFVVGTGSRTSAIAWAALNAGMWIGAIVLLRWNPIGVVTWWMD